jgi:hypothetical protein
VHAGLHLILRWTVEQVNRDATQVLLEGEANERPTVVPVESYMLCGMQACYLCVQIAYTRHFPIALT